MLKLVDIAAQHKELKKELKGAVKEVVNTSSFVGGSILKDFENSFASFNKTNFVTGVSNGTSAIEIALRCFGIGYGDEVITVANTFFATVEAIYNVGAKPVFIDVSEIDGLMNLDLIEKAVTENTRAIIPVHLFGHLVDIKKLMEIAQRHNLIVIEDAAQAHGAFAPWGTPGSISDCATFSFYPGKNLGAWGDAGAITTNKIELNTKFQKLRDHGRLSKYEHDLIGTNARMDTLQAAILKVKLSQLKKWNNRRSEIAILYNSEFHAQGFKTLFEPNKYNSAWHLYVVRVSNRQEIQDYLTQNGIETGIHYPVPLHRQPALEAKFQNINLPVTELLAKQIITIPLHPHLKNQDQSKIISKFIRVAKI